MTALELTPPAPITADHDLADFDSGESSLDEWLKKRALKNQAPPRAGAIPIIDGGTLVGAIGVAGANRLEQDVLCCRAALAVF